MTMVNVTDYFMFCDFNDEPGDIVSTGYDAGIRLGEVIDQDMIAVPRSRTRPAAPQRVTVDCYTF